MKSLSRVRPLVTLWTAAYQAPLSMGFSRQEYWSGVPLPSPYICINTYKYAIKRNVFFMFQGEMCTYLKWWLWRIDAFELWCWRRLLRVPWAARRSNQSILKEISPEYSLEGLMLKLKLQYFDHLMRRTDSFEKILMLGKVEGRRGWQRMR